ncbi:hypothetical protein CU311_06640 [Prochlorococcus marinus str. MU1402]|uniref:glycosyltransferase n=1 Tax=Prochlorococcus marinus TaxID=1219 RepID=UPI001ADC1620|nr:glycosyltransferase [Prochlorococcus marinus]MBO8232356.1 glycosyltransferase [Prochlorococcus marinus XMU1402]MBW3057084.1 hypothetical protein [Prochlorococcus marinus str. MU1402]
MPKILIFDKGGRKEREELVKNNQAPKDFFQSIDFLRAKGFDINHLSSSGEYKKNLFNLFGRIIEDFFCKISNIGLRPLSVAKFKRIIKVSDYVVSLTDGFSISLAFYYTFIDTKTKIKLVGAFHKLSDYDTNLPKFLKKFYYKLFFKILKRLDFIIFYGNADRLNSIKNFNIKKEKTFLIRFGVDTKFWEPNKKINFNSNYLFSIGQDPARDFNTLLKVSTKKKIHIHTSLLNFRDDSKFKITNGTYHKSKNSLSDLQIKKLYQDSFAVIVPLKDVFQPSGYSVTLQAMACGKPVIITYTKGLWAPEVFHNLKNCIFVKPGDVRGIENAIKLLENDRKTYEYISKEARKIVEEHFSLINANISTLSIFEKFLIS